MTSAAIEETAGEEGESEVKIESANEKIMEVWESTAKCTNFDFKLTTDDKETSFEKYFQEKGMPVVICFYCSYAAICHKPAKAFSRNAEKLSGKAAFLLLNCDPIPPAKKGSWAKEFAKSNEIPHCDHGYVDEKNDKILSLGYQVQYIPHFTIVWVNGPKMAYKNADERGRYEEKCYMDELTKAINDFDEQKRKSELVVSTPKAGKQAKAAGEVFF